MSRLQSLKSSQKLSVTDAQQTINAYASCQLDTEIIDIDQAIGRICADNILAMSDYPAFSHAAMDGFAFATPKTVFAPITLKVVDTVKAGHAYTQALEPNTCVRIMTGAPVPPNSDCVVMQENVTYPDDTHITVLPENQTTGDNIRMQGETIQTGSILIKAGTQLNETHIALLIQQKITGVTVYKRLRVGVLSTGDELGTAPDADAVATITDTNRPLLLALISKMGFYAVDLGTVSDSRDQLQQTLQSAAQGVDVILTTGGVSVGIADYTKDVLAQSGEIVFWSIKMRPGKPMAMGRIAQDKHNVLVFGLPGNPVAAVVSFCFFVRNALRICAGAAPEALKRFTAIADEPFKKRKGRTEFQRGRLTQDETGRLTVKPVGAQGAADLFALSRADCFVILEESSGPVAVGEPVFVVPMSYFFS